MEEYYPRPEDEVSSLIEYHVGLETADPTGKVSNGYICVRGPVTEMAVSLASGWAPASEISSHEQAQ